MVKPTIYVFAIALILGSCNDKELKRTYYPSGKLETVSEVIGNRKNGLGQIFYENGVVKYEGPYNNDLRQGWHIWYDTTGKVYQKAFYSNSGGKELAQQTLRYNGKGDLIFDYRFALKKVSVTVTNPKPYRVMDVLSVKLTIEDPKHVYSEAVFGNFDENLNILSNPQEFSDELPGNAAHEIFMRIQLPKAGPDTLTWLVRDFDFKYRTDSTGTYFGEEAFVGFPVDVLPNK